MDQEGEQEDQSEQTGSYPLRCSSQFVPLSLSSPLRLSTVTPLSMLPCKPRVSVEPKGGEWDGRGESPRGVELGRGSN